MSERIFKTRGPLDPDEDQAIFVERAELHDILQLVRGLSVDNYVALLGSRQTGKTTLLYKAKVVLREEDYRAAFIDLSGLENQSEASCYAHVCTQLYRELEDLLGPEADWKPAEVSGPVPFRQFLLRVAESAPVSRLVIMLDEVGAFPANLADAFFGTIRNVFSSRHKESEQVLQKYLFIFSGAVDLHKLTSGENSPLNICERVYLQDLEREGVHQLVGNLRRLNLSVSSDVAEYIFSQTEGHPYLTQRICSYFERAPTLPLTRASVDRVIERMLRGDDNLKHVITQVSEEEEAKELLRQIVVDGQEVPFSRVNPLVAQLEVIGAVKGNGYCKVRNPIYKQALSNYFGAPSKSRAWKGSDWLTLLLILLFLLFAPSLFFYLRDIVLSPRFVTQVWEMPELEATATVRYGPVLRDGREHEILIEVQRPSNGGEPITVRIDSQSLDLAVKGEFSLEFAAQRENKSFYLELMRGFAVPNFLAPFTEKRSFDLSFQSDLKKVTHTVDLRTDYFSTFVASSLLWLAGIVGAVSTILTNLETIQAMPERIRKLLGKEK
ncbi:MAG: AAA-like domain-containing protein [Anaerolineae bacterium]